MCLFHNKEKYGNVTDLLSIQFPFPPLFFAGRTVVHAPTTGLKEGSKSITVVAILLPVMPIKYEGKSVKGNVVG